MVVGPYENNVFVVRCRQTGDAVLIDAANEHEQLLELCQRSACAGCSRRTATGTTSRPCRRSARPATRSPSPQLDAPKLKDVGYDVFLDDAEVIEVGELRLDAIHNPGHTPGSISFHVRGTPLLFTGDTLFPGGPGNTKFDGRRLRDDHPLDRGAAVHVPRHDDRAARPRRRHDDRRRAPAPRRVDRPRLVSRIPDSHRDPVAISHASRENPASGICTTAVVIIPGPGNTLGGMTELFRVDGLWAAPTEALADERGRAEPILQGLDLAVEPARCTPSWAPTGRARARSPSR